jgi:hypothetical protein
MKFALLDTVDQAMHRIDTCACAVAAEVSGIINEQAEMIRSIAGALTEHDKENAAGSTSAGGANRSVCDGGHWKGNHHAQG